MFRMTQRMTQYGCRVRLFSIIRRIGLRGWHFIIRLVTPIRPSQSIYFLSRSLYGLY